MVLASAGTILTASAPASLVGVGLAGSPVGEGFPGSPVGAGVPEGVSDGVGTPGSPVGVRLPASPVGVGAPEEGDGFAEESPSRLVAGLPQPASRPRRSARMRSLAIEFVDFIFLVLFFSLLIFFICLILLMLFILLLNIWKLVHFCFAFSFDKFLSVFAPVVK